MDGGGGGGYEQNIIHIVVISNGRIKLIDTNTQISKSMCQEVNHQAKVSIYINLAFAIALGLP